MDGKMVSHYIIFEKPGEVGMGTVYKAEETKPNIPVSCCLAYCNRRQKIEQIDMIIVKTQGV
jgi:hypothetical protein